MSKQRLVRAGNGYLLLKERFVCLGCGRETDSSRRSGRCSKCGSVIVRKLVVESDIKRE